MSSPQMPFGLHKGEPLATLPDEYLLWVGCLDDLRQPLLGHVLREMGRRLAERPAAEGAVQE
jgi:uncharacterized protein (DUF3820 family)